MATKKSGKIGAKVRLHLDINLQALAKELVKRYHDYKLRPEHGGGELEERKLSMCLGNLTKLGLMVTMFDDYPKITDAYVLRNKVSGTKTIWLGTAGYEIGFTNLEFARLVKTELEKIRLDSGGIKIYKEVE